MSKRANIIKPGNINLILPGKKYVDGLYNTLSKSNSHLSKENITIVVINLMQLVEKYPDLTGEQKKHLVIHVVKKFIKDKTDKEEEQVLLTFVDVFLPTIIDTLVSVDKKELAIKIKKTFSSCFPYC